MKLFGGKPKKTPKKKSSAGFAKWLHKNRKIVIPALLVAVALSLILLALAIRHAAFHGSEPTISTANPGDLVDRAADAVGIYNKEHKDDFLTVLIVGKDKVGLNTDTIMLAAFDTAQGKLNILNIPRDTIVNVKRSNKKINAAYGVGGKGNIEELMQEVHSVTGVYPDKYVLVNLDGFIEMVDAIGGVTVDVPINMVYNDPAQDLKINIKKGLQTLNGYDAMGFMRYRHTYAEGDIGRIKVQHIFIKALANQMLRPETLTKIPKLANVVFDNIKTDLSLGNVVWLGKELIKIDAAEDIEMFLLPGYPNYYQRLSYYFPDEKEVVDLINEKFNPYVEAVASLNLITVSEEPKTESAAKKETAQKEEPKTETPAELPEGLEEVPEGFEEVPEDLPDEEPSTEDSVEEGPDPEGIPVEDLIPDDFYVNE